MLVGALTLGCRHEEGGPSALVADGSTGGRSSELEAGGGTGNRSTHAGGGGGAEGDEVRVVEWVVSTDPSRWEERPRPAVEALVGISDQTVEVDETARAQEIDGFGACFNELGWEAMSVLDPAARDDILRNLFDEATGCGFTMARMPIGASDYAVGWYSLDDNPGDYAMAQFSIERDRERLIPFIEAAMQYSPHLRVWGSPWSPPTWMKTNSDYAGGRLTQDAQTLSAHARYLEQYVRAYRAEGIDVYAVHVQNEPYASQVFPSCLWSPAELRDYIRDYLGPHFAATQLDAEIWLGTLNIGDYETGAKVVLDDPAAAAYIAGVAYQWAGKDSIGDTHRDHPEMRLMQSETECGDGSNDWAYAEYTWSLFRHYLENGANSYFQWNMVLDETGLSSWNWAQSAMITVDRQTATVTYNPQFHLVKHISHYVRPGAYRLVNPGPYADALIFENLDGSKVVVLANRTDSEQLVRVQLGSRMAEVSLDPRSFSTLVTSDF